MESPLSFDSTENFRKKLLLKNLKPYTVDGTFSAPKLENKKEIVLVDYSVSDSPDINKEQKQQEKKLIGQNKYNPNNIILYSTFSLPNNICNLTMTAIK